MTNSKYLQIQNVEAADVINQLDWSFIVECDCSSLLQNKSLVSKTNVSNNITSSLLMAAYAAYLYPGYRGKVTILPVVTGCWIGLLDKGP